MLMVLLVLIVLTVLIAMIVLIVLLVLLVLMVLTLLTVLMVLTLLIVTNLYIKLLLDQGINHNEDLPQLIGNLGDLLFCLSRNLSISL